MLFLNIHLTQKINIYLFNCINSSCWLSGYSAIFSILMPIFLILIFNSIIFGLILRKHCVCFAKRKLQIAVASKNTSPKRQTILLSTSFVNMGLTWLTGFLLVFQMNEYVKTTLALFFCLFNAFQGFLIFAVYVVLSKARRDCIKHVTIEQFRKLKKSMGFLKSKYSVNSIGTSSEQHKQSQVGKVENKMKRNQKSSEISNQTQEVKLTTSSNSKSTKSK